MENGHSHIVAIGLRSISKLGGELTDIVFMGKIVDCLRDSAGTSISIFLSKISISSPSRINEPKIARTKKYQYYKFHFVLSLSIFR